MSEWPKPEFEVPLQEEAKQTQAILENLRKVKPEFNSPEFEGIKNEAGLNRFALSVKQWVEKTRSKGIIAKPGRYGGTYAHRALFENGRKESRRGAKIAKMDENGIGKEIVNKDSFAILAAWREKENSNTRMLRTTDTAAEP